MKRKVLSAVMAVSLTATSLAGNGITFPVKDVKAASDEGVIGVIYKHGGYSSSYDAQNAYTGNDLGCTYTKEKTTFKVWSPEATKVTLKRYATGSDGEKGAKDLGTVEMTKGDKGVWSCTVDGDIVNTYYTYDTVIGGTTYKDAVDIYAKAVGVNGDRGMVVDLDSTDPDNWDQKYDSKREAMKIGEISVWEVHIRDFSIDVSSGVSEENRGKYKAFTETGTTINGEGRVSTCVDYLKQLGVTHVQLMPMYDYASVDETKVSNSLGSNYNWGYDPKNYNAPEGSYSSDPYDGNVRIKEMKEMIQALHDAGIKVIMDVVYNHTYETRNSNFTKLMPDYYYKLSGDSYNNQSGCGNATRSTAAMYNKFMRESLLYWAEEYHLDGFRFDLMGIHDYNTMNQIRQDMDKKFGEDTIILYGEGWTATEADSDGAWKGNEGSLAPDIGYFNDQIRDAIKGEHKFDGTIGLVQTNYASGSYVQGDPQNPKWPDNVFGGIMGSVGKSGGNWWMWRGFWSKSSNSVIAYCSAHDNLTLWDKLAAVEGKNFSSTSDKMLRMNKMAGAVTLVSHGGYFMQAGEEFARTKNGDDNSYKSPDSINKIDWNRVSDYSNIQKYYEGMLEIRQVFSGFEKEYTRSNDNWHPNGMNMEWLSTKADGITAFTMTNSTSGEWNKIGVIINNTTQDTTFSLGTGKWVVIADGNTAGLTKIAEYDGSAVKAAGKSVVVAVPKDTFDANPDVAKLLRKNQDTNHAPTISIDTESTIEVEPESQVTIHVTAKDADGDKVTLSAENLPDGAEFDASTGVFTWDNATKGTHTVTFTATDGTAKSSKEVTIKVSSETGSLEELVAEIEAAKLSKDDFTEQVFSDLQSALDNAKDVIAQSNPSGEDCEKASNALQKAYDKVKEEKTAREKLETYVETASKAIDNADSSVDADLVKDAKQVLKDTEELLGGVAKAMAYSFAQDNLTESVNALVVEGKPGIHVSTNFANPHIHIWTGSGTSEKVLTGEWPGAALTEKDEDGNYFYELPTDGAYHVVINNGGKGSQSSDVKDNTGSILITVAGSSSSKKDGNDIYTAKVEKVSDGGSAPEITKEGLNSVIELAKKYDSENYTEDSYKTLGEQITAAEKVAGDKNATQLTINQQARALRSAILSLVAVKEDVIDPTVTPVETTAPPIVSDEPVQTPETTPEIPATPDVTGEVEETVAPVVSASAQPSEAPGSSLEPSQAPVPTTTVAATTTTTPTPTPQVNTSNKPSSTTPVNNVDTTSNSAVNVEASELKIKSVSCNPVLCQVVNKSVKISVAAEGGIGTQQYKLEVYKGSKLIIASEYGNSNTFSYRAPSAGSYTFKVYVKDEQNKEVSKTKKFTFVSKALSLKISKRVAKKNVTLTASVSGGLKSYRYKYVIKNAKGKIVKKTGYVSKKKLIWKTSKKGTYKVTITVKDATGTTKSKTTTVKKK